MNVIIVLVDIVARITIVTATIIVVIVSVSFLLVYCSVSEGREMLLLQLLTKVSILILWILF